MSLIEITQAAPAIIDVTGTTKSERQMSVVSAASAIALSALCDSKGKLGKAVRHSFALTGLERIAKAAAWPTCNYRPMGEYLAAQLGEPIVITNRASFLSLADQFEMRILKIKSGKTGGMTTDKKTGALKSNASLSLAMKLKSDIVNTIELVEVLSAEAKAKSNQPALTV